MTDKMAEKDFTPRELEVMAKVSGESASVLTSLTYAMQAWSCMTEEPKVNYDKLAEACGMGNPRSAANAWRAIKAKIMAKGKATFTHLPRLRK